MSDQQSKTVTANQVDTVLQDYLDQLLVAAMVSASPAETVQTEVQDAAVPVAASQPVKAIPAARPVLTDEPARPSVLQQSLVLPLTAAPVSEAPAAEVVDATDVNELSSEDEVQTPQSMASLNWRSSQGIDCLIFKVAGLKLAIPLPLLGGVHNVTDKVTPLFGQAVWSLGIWQSEKSKLTIIDSAQLIMPERNIRLAEEGYSFFIQLDRSPWALACQEICDTVTLVHDSIKWRGETSKRPWLAGTVISEMCALVDVPGLLKLLNENSRIRA